MHVVFLRETCKWDVNGYPSFKLCLSNDIITLIGSIVLLWSDSTYLALCSIGIKHVSCHISWREDTDIEFQYYSNNSDMISSFWCLWGNVALIEGMNRTFLKCTLCLLSFMDLHLNLRFIFIFTKKWRNRQKMVCAETFWKLFWDAQKVKSGWYKLELSLVFSHSLTVCCFLTYF